jgi:site-specific recombinase XerD
MQIRVTAGKGTKDRCTVFTEVALQVLRDYCRAYSQETGFFPLRIQAIIYPNVRRSTFSKQQRKKPVS